MVELEVAQMPPLGITRRAAPQADLRSLAPQPGPFGCVRLKGAALAKMPTAASSRLSLRNAKGRARVRPSEAPWESDFALIAAGKGQASGYEPQGMPRD